MAGSTRLCRTYLAAVQLVGIIQLCQALSSELITAVNDPPAQGKADGKLTHCKSDPWVEHDSPVAWTVSEPTPLTAWRKLAALASAATADTSKKQPEQQRQSPAHRSYQHAVPSPVRLHQHCRSQVLVTVPPVAGAAGAAACAQDALIQPIQLCAAFLALEVLSRVRAWTRPVWQKGEGGGATK